jgi:hypothetical protein
MSWLLLKQHNKGFANARVPMNDLRKRTVLGDAERVLLEVCQEWVLWSNKHDAVARHEKEERMRVARLGMSRTGE